MRHHRRGDHIPDVLRVARLPFKRLERDSHALARLVERGTAGIPLINRSVDLDPEEVSRAVDVGSDFDSGHDPLSDADGVAAERIAHDGHGVLQPRQRAERERLDVGEERGVVHG